MAPFERKAVHNVLIVDDLVPDVDRRAVLGDREFHDLDRAVDAGAEASGSGHEQR